MRLAMEQKEEFVRFVEWIPFPAWLMSPAGTLLYANEAMLNGLNSTQIHIAGLHNPKDLGKLPPHFYTGRLGVIGATGN